MKIYLVQNIQGYFIGSFRGLRWTNAPSLIEPTVAVDMRGIDRDILVAYWWYLWRLGQYTFGAAYTFGRPPARGALSLERFAEYFYMKLWPTYGRMWSAVGATKGRFEAQECLDANQIIQLHEVWKVVGGNNYILRYNEFLWWARPIWSVMEGKWIYETGLPIGAYLMFEQRTKRKTPPKIDKWNFGMLWWEVIRAGKFLEVYLWATAEVEYLGFAVRKSATALSLKAKKP